MIGDIAKKEFLLNIMTFKFAVGTVVCVLLSAVFMPILAADYRQRLETYNMLHHFDASAAFTDDFFMRVDELVAIKHMQEQYYSVANSGMLDRMLLLDWKQTLADNDLRKVNGMCDLA